MNFEQLKSSLVFNHDVVQELFKGQGHSEYNLHMSEHISFRWPDSLKNDPLKGEGDRRKIIKKYEPL